MFRKGTSGEADPSGNDSEIARSSPVKVSARRTGDCPGRPGPISCFLYDWRCGQTDEKEHFSQIDRRRVCSVRRGAPPGESRRNCWTIPNCSSFLQGDRNTHRVSLAFPSYERGDRDQGERAGQSCLKCDGGTGWQVGKQADGLGKKSRGDGGILYGNMESRWIPGWQIPGQVYFWNVVCVISGGRRTVFKRIIPDK